MPDFMAKYGIWAFYGLMISLPVGVLGAWLLSRRRPALRRGKTFTWVTLLITSLSFGGLSVWFYLKTHDYYNLESIQLPPGYRLKHGSGDDTYCGNITSPEGDRIGIDIGALAGSFANPAKPEKYLWISEHRYHGQQVFIGLRRPYGAMKHPLLCVTYRKHGVNFFSDVQNDQEIEEKLSIILTYVPRD